MASVSSMWDDEKEYGARCTRGHSDMPVCIQAAQDVVNEGQQTSSNQLKAQSATAPDVHSEAHHLRTARVRDRLKIGTFTTPGPVRSTPFTTQFLQQHENGGGAIGEKKMTVAWQVCPLYM